MASLAGCVVTEEDAQELLRWSYDIEFDEDEPKMAVNVDGTIGDINTAEVVMDVSVFIDGEQVAVKRIRTRVTDKKTDWGTAFILSQEEGEVRVDVDVVCVKDSGGEGEPCEPTTNDS